MKSPVQLYIRVRLEDGSYPYLRAAMQSNGHVRAGYVINASRAVKVTHGVYQLRYQRDGKRVWEPVGTKADVALLALRRKLREFEDGELGLTSTPPPALPGERHAQSALRSPSKRPLIA